MARRGRPPILVLDPKRDGPIEQAVATIDDRGRLQLPQRIVGGIGWVSKEQETDALAILNEPGSIILRAWVPFGESVVERRRRFIETAASDPSELEPLRAIEDRYKRLRIPKSHRPTLQAEMLLHLGIPLLAPAAVYVWRVADALELTSVQYRLAGLSDEWEELSDLP